MKKRILEKRILLLPLVLIFSMLLGACFGGNTVRLGVKDENKGLSKGSKFQKKFFEESYFGKLTLNGSPEQELSVIVIEKEDGLTKRWHFAQRDLTQKDEAFEFGLLSSVYQKDSIIYRDLEFVDEQEAVDGEKVEGPLLLSGQQTLLVKDSSEVGKDDSVMQLKRMPKQGWKGLGEPLFLLCGMENASSSYDLTQIRTMDDILSIDNRETGKVVVIGLVVMSGRQTEGEARIVSYNPLLDGQRYEDMAKRALEDAQQSDYGQGEEPYVLR